MEVVVSCTLVSYHRALGIYNFHWYLHRVVVACPSRKGVPSDAL